MAIQRPENRPGRYDVCVCIVRFVDIKYVDSATPKAHAMNHPKPEADSKPVSEESLKDAVRQLLDTQPQHKPSKKPTKTRTTTESKNK
jgi:hypothetical protein